MHLANVNASGQCKCICRPISDLESQTPTNMSNDAIASMIYEYQQNKSCDRLTTLEIEDLYRNITSQGQSS